ncbi:ribosomal protein S5 domain 2-type protein [Gorgonomyces haynaldii]|nr:ribosomal protein S5 domain 2-type protein [Gorgonomyces haynaldii]
MAIEPPPSTNEQTFVIESIKQGYRTDGRLLNDMRPVKISLGPNPGQAQVLLGSTRVSATVNCEITRPNPSNPTEGSILFRTAVSPMASQYADGDWTDTDVVNLSRLLEKALKKARAVDTEGLCIIAGEKVWIIRVEILVLDNQGNMVDCAGLAAMAALMHFKRPDVTVDGNDVILHPANEKELIPLSVHHIPIFTTFEFFDNGERHVVDPNLLEEQVGAGQLTLVMNMHREVCTLKKDGGHAIPVEKLMQCIQIASAKVDELTLILKEALQSA